MTFDTSGLQDWPQPEAMDTASGALATKATSFREGVEDCETLWKSITAHYESENAEEMDRVRTFFDLVTAHGDLVEAAAKKVKDVMGTFADDVRGLQTRRTQAWNRIDEYERAIAAGEEPTGIYSQASVQGYINTIVTDLNTAAETCSSSLEGIDPQALTDEGLMPSFGPGDAVSVAAMTSYERVSYTYTVIERHQVQVWDYTVTAPSADWVVDSDGNATRAPFIAGRENAGYRYETVEVQQRGVRTEWVAMRTPINPWAYRNIPAYRNRVDFNPDRYSPSGPRFWDIQGRMDDLENGLRNGSGWSRALRAAGPVATIASAGITYSSEYDTALQELAHENPDWSQDQLQSRAREMAGVQGTTQVALDFGYGAAGATIGTFIGGPVGTVVGFGAGMAIGWIAENTGFNDFVKDTAQDLWDGGKDVVEDIGESISDAWNSVFG